MRILISIFYFIFVNVYAQPLSIHPLSQENLDALEKYNISMDYSRAYLGKPMTYKSILMKSLLTQWGVKKEHVVELIAKDNFSVFVPAYLFFQTGKKDSIAYLALEPKECWPKLNNGTNSSAGPFQVIWTKPNYSHISDEYWAWSVTNIAIHKTYPKGSLAPPPHTNNQSIKHGYHIYISHCASCHTINNLGKATIGPDLGKEKNPVNCYPDISDLKAFIRNPNKFRPGRMSGSSKVGMNDRELNYLIDYFSYLNSKDSVGE